MIYEAAVMAKADLGEEKLNVVKAMVSNLVQEKQGEVLVNDDWGVKSFAQALAKGRNKGHYLYFMYKSEGSLNKELERRLGISEDVIRTMIVVLGPDSKQSDIVKKYKNPFS